MANPIIVLYAEVERKELGQPRSLGALAFCTRVFVDAIRMSWNLHMSMEVLMRGRQAGDGHKKEKANDERMYPEIKKVLGLVATPRNQQR